MNSRITKGIAGIIALGSLGAADVSTFERVPIQAQERVIAGERVSVKQTENVVEATMPWKGEKGLNIKYDLGAPSLKEKLKDKESKKAIAEPVDFGDGGFKIDILLSEKPDTNTFCYDIEGYEDYDFFYQPALTAEEIAQGAGRPEEIVGSYAVYHKTLKNHKIGGQNYATGKVLHIPFPYIWEVGNEGEKVRAENLTYEDGRLCVVAPQAFLDSADYSNGVRIDPTFGYEIIGASSQSTEFGIMIGSLFAAPGDGQIDSIAVAGAADEDIPSCHKVVLVDSSRVIAANGIGGAAACTTDVHTFDTATYSVKPTITASASYYLSAVGEEDIGTSRASFDAGSVNQGNTDTSNSFSSPTNPSDGTLSTRKYSIYATYTASGGGGGAAPAKQDAIFFD